MTDLEDLMQNNIDWANKIKSEQPDFFERLAQQQSPQYLWIGCSDSRVPANEIVGLLPGELFVHRNVANVVIHTDMNCLSVLDYAIDVLKIKHIIVCGHYGCGGINAALGDRQLGLIDHWLRNIRDIYYNHKDAICSLPSEKQQIDRLCELNVSQQVANVAHTNVVQNAWRRGQSLTIHGWIYDIHDGLLKKLTRSINCIEQIPMQYRLKQD
jgi:carbonic anhydrase